MFEIPVWTRAEPSIISSEAGRQIDFNNEQPESASTSIRVSLDPDSNVNVESDLHDAKERSPRQSTDAGRQIDRKDFQPQSPFVSIRVRFEPDSNAIYSIDGDSSNNASASRLERIRTIDRGMRRFVTIVTGKDENDSNETGNISPPL
jgi:hypothetical protein